MIDLKLIRDNPSFLDEALKRGVKMDYLQLFLSSIRKIEK